MATTYKIRGCGPTARKVFLELRDSLPFFHEAQGSGWQDHQAWLFEAAGFVPVSEYAGCPAILGEFVYTRRTAIQSATVYDDILRVIQAKLAKGGISILADKAGNPDRFRSFGIHLGTVAALLERAPDWDLYQRGDRFQLRLK